MYAVSIFAFRASAQWKALHSNLNMPILPFTNGEGIIGLFCPRETIPSFSSHDRRSDIKSQLNDAHVRDGKRECGSWKATPLCLLVCYPSALALGHRTLLVPVSSTVIKITIIEMDKLECKAAGRTRPFTNTCGDNNCRRNP